MNGGNLMGNEPKTLKEKFLTKLMNDSLWAVLFLMLLVYVINDAKAREDKYQETIKYLSQDIYEQVKDTNNKMNDILKVVYSR